MGKRCIVCKKLQGKGNQTYHRFPKDVERRNTWRMILAIDKENLTKTAFVCSNHFMDSDFVKKPRGAVWLKKDALPIRLSESPVLQSFSTKKNMLMAQQRILQSSPLRPRSTHSSSTLTASSPTLTAQSSSTLSASPYGSTGRAASNTNIILPPKKKKKLSHPRYFGDCDSDDINDPVKAKRNWNLAKKIIMEQRRKINALTTAKRRLKNKISNLVSLLSYFKRQNMISYSGESMINASLDKNTKNILSHFLKGPSKQKHTPELRSFALTLHFYSSKAYNYIREKFNRTLPHPRTISKWYQVVDGRPGFTKEALSDLKQKTKAASEKGTKVICNLVIDEMAIKSQVEWTGEEVKGYVDMGCDINSDVAVVAKEALVFMLVAVNDHWKIPVGYFLLNGLSGAEKANLINKCLNFLQELSN